VVSHDRYFLDKVAGKIIELEFGTAKTYKTNYSGFIDLKARQQEALLKQAAGRNRPGPGFYSTQYGSGCHRQKCPEPSEGAGENGISGSSGAQTKTDPFFL